MADIIKFATGEELKAILEANNQMVSGMTPEEARVALKLVESGGKLMTGSATTGGANNVVQFPETDASGAFNGYVTGGGTTSAANSATVSATSSATIAQGVTESGKTTVLGVLSMNLPTVAAAVAPILGVALGAGLYSTNPDLWTKISKTLLPFCYNDTEVAPAVIDSNGQVYINGKIVDSLQKFFESENIGKGGYVSDLNVNNYALPIKTGNLLYLKSEICKYTRSTYRQIIVGPFTVPAGIQFAGNVNTKLTGLNCIFASKSKFEFEIGYIDNRWETKTKPSEGTPPDYSYQEKQKVWTSSNPTSGVYYFEGIGLFNLEDTPSSEGKYVEVNCPFSVSSDGKSLKADKPVNVAKTILGDRIVQNFPNGTENWTGTKPSNPASGSVNVTVDSAGNTEPYYPITLPVGDPGVSNNPATNPNPTAPVEFPEVVYSYSCKPFNLSSRNSGSR